MGSAISRSVHGMGADRMARLHVDEFPILRTLY